MAGENSGINIESAVTEISAGLGLDFNEGASNGNHSDGRGAGEAPEPTNTSSDSGADARAAGNAGAADADATGDRPQEPGAAGDAKPAGEGADGDPTPAPSPNDPPKTWRPDAAAKWATLDPVVRAEVQKREDDFFRGIEGYKQDANVGKNFLSAVEPFLPILNHYGIDPYQQVSGLMRAHQTLALGTAPQKAALFQQLAKDYNVDLAAIAQPAEESAYVDPEVTRLRQSQEEMRMQLEGLTTQQRQQRAAELRTSIDKFAADAKNVYFAEVASDMATLIQAGVAKTLEDAYSKAIWQNPTVRAKEIARQTAEAQETERRKAEEKAAKARKAAAANAPSSRPTSRTAPAGTMDDTLAETLAAIKARG